MSDNSSGNTGTPAIIETGLIALDVDLGEGTLQPHGEVAATPDDGPRRRDRGVGAEQKQHPPECAAGALPMPSTSGEGGRID